MNKQPKHIDFEHSAQYWEERYQQEGNSGAGSYGRLADFKAEVINQFVSEHNLQTVIEFGCGDGNQLSLSSYPHYTGFDVAREAIARCQKIFEKDSRKQFLHVSEWAEQQAELVLSLDVIYHLIEENIYDDYMTKLFASSTRFVIIYASNNEEFNRLLGDHVKHVRHRKFTDWVVKNNASSWSLYRYVMNRYPFDINDQNNTSFADFYIFERRGR